MHVEIQGTSRRRSMTSPSFPFVAYRRHPLTGIVQLASLATFHIFIFSYPPARRDFLTVRSVIIAGNRPSSTSWTTDTNQQRIPHRRNELFQDETAHTDRPSPFIKRQSSQTRFFSSRRRRSTQGALNTMQPNAWSDACWLTTGERRGIEMPATN